MILIISTKDDETTTYVIEWLIMQNKNWIRINENDIINLIFVGKDIQFIVGENVFLMSDIESCWYRRGFLNINWNYLLEDKIIKRVQENEKVKIINFIYYLLKGKKTINNFLNSDVNKLIVSSIATKIGIKTTQDYIISSKDELLKLSFTENKYISKPISGDSVMNYGDFCIFNYTTKVDKSVVVTDTFYPSLVQEYVEKKYELRIFYLHGDFYSMAIFSQNDNQTEVDFRNYNSIKPNRRVPFKLPKIEEVKLHQLMNELNLNSGSIDMIVTPSNDYIFLEVNPVGQFGMVSYPCNYNLEKKIAKYL